ncbi:hypothetical protein Q9S36_03050 [Microbacterium sp. ARD31]|uniref:hypothetical protein n=1 Tax=Microbacterium sp. ARD31 TaxID=2962576 RepID=UPI0028811A1C|nr:hypothetical protein [Microbacterium sp. ARD31]MDT0179185.1 hypothetical protein [Microbacterium sp. ARD31]
MALKRKITDRAWESIEVGRNITLIARADQFAPRLDLGGSPAAEGEVMNGNVIHKRAEYIVLEDVHSFVVQRDEVHKVVLH